MGRGKNKSARSVAKDAIFFETLRHDGVVSRACVVSGYTNVSVYEWRKTDPEFARLWAEALEYNTQELEREMYNRAVRGDETYVVSQGKIVYVNIPTEKLDENGDPIMKKVPLMERKKSDTLAIFLAKARRPETYRERYDVNVGAKQNIAPVDLSETELEALIAEELTRRGVSDD